jgi:hypothetical protein|tara:strand:+ start:725 stop:1258 length:534 start_codon:yes stop_codon:yes gene_type:complete
VKNKKSIYVQDNFFDKEIFQIIQNEVLSSEFKPRHSDVYKKSSDDSQRGEHQKTYHHVQLLLDSKCVLETKKNIKKYFDYTVKRIESYYFLSFPNTPAIPHHDVCAYNCLIYLVGDKLINNGTGFYEKFNDQYQLHTHIGFKENRAILFNPSIHHCPLQFAGNSTPRYIMSNFCHDT